MERIQAFLLSESRQDDRIKQDPSKKMPVESPSDALELVPIPLASSSSSVIIVRDLHARPSPSAPVVLYGLDLQVNKGSLVMLVGTVGAGKSTFLKSLIGELKIESGTISTATKNIAYCSQSPWLPNATVREIVCGSLGHDDPQWYHTVLHACAFDEDVLELPNHDDTLIGSRGVTLSGGQKQRLVGFVCSFRIVPG